MSRFEVGDLVWAKMKGSPAWPALITKPSKGRKNQQWVYFFGTENYGWIESGQIWHYHAKKKEYEGEKQGRYKASFADAFKKAEEHFAKKVDPNYKIVLPPPQTDDPTPKKQPVKRLSKEVTSDKVVTPVIKKRRASPRIEENGSLGALGESMSDQSVDYRGNSPQPEVSTMEESNNKIPTPSNLAFGFIGLGIMGTGIVGNLINSGHSVNIFNRTMDKCVEMKNKYLSRLVTVRESPLDVVLNSDVIFSCVSDASVCTENLFGNFGVLSESMEGKGYVEMTGIDPKTSLELCTAIEGKGGKYLEAQLQGSKKEAEEGNLVILSAGDHSLFEKCQSCFQAMGKTAFFLGNVGYAAKMNLVLNLITTVSLVGLTEAFGLAERCGLSSEIALDIFKVTNMACPYLQQKATRLVERNFDNPEHPLQHMQKDIQLCLDLSNTLKQPLLMASTANEIMKHARRVGYDGQDCSCVFMKSKF